MKSSSAFAASRRPTTPIVQTYTTNEVSHLTGATPRMLQWWDERNLVVPDMVSHLKLYSEEDFQKVALIMELKRKNLTLNQIRKALPKILKQNASYALFSDGKLVFLDSPGEVIQFSLKAKGGVILVDLGRVRRSAGD